LWSNIIKNAIEAIEETNRKGKIRIYSKESSERLIVVIENNGPKIPNQVIDSMFKKFFTTKGQKNGSGLGLSIVNKILEEHEASIDVSSDDTLTRFEISFPKSQYIC
jgi:signal transduction histidine kinase